VSNASPQKGNAPAKQLSLLGLPDLSFSVDDCGTSNLAEGPSDP
jgi:hypothetical protein